MHLKILLPTEILVDQKVNKITAEADDGEFCLLPRHVDYVSAIVPGILTYEDEEGGEQFAAVDRGVLVKAGDNVLVSVRRGACGAELGKLRDIVDEKYRTLDDHEKKARTALARLEARMVKKLIES